MFKKIFMCALVVVIIVLGVFTFEKMYIQKEKDDSHVTVEYQHVRNATAKVKYGGLTFLIDPFLAEKDAYPGFESALYNPEQRIPSIDLPESAEDVINGVDAVIVTHTHLDHWDIAAQNILPKDIPLFVQNAGDATIIRNQGFTDVRVLGINTPFGNVKISQTEGQHGSDEMYSLPAYSEALDEAMGFVLQAENSKTVYFAGDTIWSDYVDDALARYNPEVIVLNTGYARINDPDGNELPGGLIMGSDDVTRAYKAAPKAQIIAVHMDAVNHTVVTSDDVRELIKEKKMENRVSVPREGEILKY